MTFTFRMRFSGLCVFVPDRPFSTVETEGGSPGRVAVLLRNLTVPEELTPKAPQGAQAGAPKKIFTDAHFPLLEFDPHNWRPTSTRIGNFTSQSSIFDSKSYCLLRGDTLRIRPDGDGAQGDGVKTPPYDFADSTSLKWVAEMVQVFPDQAKINGTFLQQMPDGDSDTAKIIARIDLNRGRLSTSRLSDGNCSIDSPVGGQQPIGFPRRVAIELLLEIPGVENEVVIEMQRSDEGNDLGFHKLILGPATSDPTDNVVEVQLHNREIDGFIGVPLDYLERKDKADFQVYYELSAKFLAQDDLRPTVTPLSAGLTPLTGTDHTGRCPPTAMA